MSRRGLTLGLAVFFTAVLVVLAALLPVPYVVLVPGPITDTLGRIGATPVIAVTGAPTYPPAGHLYLTTVGILPGSCDAHPTLSEALRAWFDRTKAVQPHQVICPPGETSSDVAAQNEQDMTQSQINAITAAMRYLGYRSTGDRIAVLSVEPDVPAADVLHAGDRILAVDGTAIGTEAQLRRVVGAHQAGDVLRVTIQGCSGPRTVRVETVAMRGRTVMGVGIGPEPQFPVSVCIGVDPSRVGGPSAGLAFTLGIIDKLTRGDLTGGHVVAATGTIDAQGKVGPIGGIQQKVAAADQAHARVFLTPADDCADAKTVASSSMTLVRVDTLATAVAALRTIASNRDTFPHC